MFRVSDDPKKFCKKLLHLLKLQILNPPPPEKSNCYKNMKNIPASTLLTFSLEISQLWDIAWFIFRTSRISAIFTILKRMLPKHSLCSLRLWRPLHGQRSDAYVLPCGCLHGSEHTPGRLQSSLLQPSRLFSPARARTAGTCWAP